MGKYRSEVPGAGGDPLKEQARQLEMKGWGSGAGASDLQKIDVPSHKKGFMRGMSPQRAAGKQSGGSAKGEVEILVSEKDQKRI